MKFRHILKMVYAAFLLLLLTHPAWSQDSVQTAKQKKSSPSRMILHLSDQDVILPITSIEWGTPDRWSITSRYVHMFEKIRNKRLWLNNLSVSLSPGTAGGRFGIGYQGILSPRSMPDFINELRIVLLRTWGNPLSTVANRTFIGAEIRSSLSGIINIGAGYYSQISSTDGHREQLYGLHFGIGI